MTKIKLRKIKNDAYDDLLDAVIENFNKDREIYLPEYEIDNGSEDILVAGNKIEVDFDEQKLLQIVNSDKNNYEKNAEIGMLLHTSLKMPDGHSIPFSIISQKEVWSYLNLTVFKDCIKKMYMSEQSKSDQDRIRRYYFNAGSGSKVSRTGFKFLWLMVDKLKSENNYEMNRVAFEFIDPVRAMFERKFTRNPDILRAFVQGIINNEESNRFKQVPYKTSVPKHLNCFAAVNFLDAYSYDELVEIITEEQKRMISNEEDVLISV